MKILIINSGRKFTGEGAHSLDLAEQLHVHGHHVLLVLRSEGNVTERARDRGLPTAALLDFAKGITPVSKLKDLTTLRKLITTEQPDIIHCHRGNDHGLAVAAIAGLRNPPPVVRTRHRGLPVNNTISNRWLFLRATSGVLAVSENAAASFGNMRPLLQDKLSVVYSAVDTDNFHSGRRSEDWRAAHGVAEDEPLIGLIARLQRVKGQLFFLRAAAIVLQDFPKARFIVAGAGPSRKKQIMETLVAELGIADRVIFKDWLPDVHTAVASLDVGVLASLSSEASSRVTYEYMASGVPVVATTVGCIPEIIQHGKTGCLVPPGDAESMANEIMDMLRHPEIANNMQQQALARVHRFHNRSHWAPDIVKAYERAITYKKTHKNLPSALCGYARTFTGK